MADHEVWHIEVSHHPGISPMVSHLPEVFDLATECGAFQTKRGFESQVWVASQDEIHSPTYQTWFSARAAAELFIARIPTVLNGALRAFNGVAYRILVWHERVSGDS